MTNPRRNHNPEFKAKVALSAIKGDQTVSELADTFEIHPTQIKKWKKQVLDEAALLFADTKEKHKNTDKQMQALHAKIGQLTMENDFLVKVLGQ